MRKKLLFGLLLFALIALPLLAACGEESPSPTGTATPTPTKTPTPTPTATPPEVIELIGTSSSGAESPPGKALARVAEKIEERSGGRVHFTLYYSASLFDSADAIRSMKNGLADLYPHWNPMGSPGVLPMEEIWMMPFLGFKSAEMATEIMNEILDNFPGFREEFQGMVVFSYQDVKTTGILSSATKTIETAADLKGMKIQTTGPEANFFENIGSTPVYVPWPDRYTSFERGVVEVATEGFGPMGASGILELMKSFTILPVLMTLQINCDIWAPDAFNSLPPDIQKIIADMGPEEIEVRNALEYEMDQVGLQAGRDDPNITVVEMSLDEVQKLLEGAKPVHDAWIAEMEAQGVPAQALYDEVMRLIAKY